MKVAGDKSMDCIEILMNDDDSLWFYHLRMVRNGNSLGVSDTNPILRPLEELQAILKPRVHLIIVLSGKGVIIKQLDCAIDDPQFPARYVFPDAEPRDFITETYQVKHGHHIVSLVRISRLQKVLSVLEKCGIRVWDIHVGPSLLSSIVPMLEPGVNSMHTSTYEVMLENNELISVQRSKIQNAIIYDLDGVKLENALLCCFAAGFVHYTQPPDRIQTTYPIVIEYRNNRKILTRVKSYLLVFLLFFLSLLVMNFLALTFLRGKNINMEQLTSRENNTIETIDSLTRVLKDREEISQKFSATLLVPNSILADRIFSTVPFGISINSISLHPIAMKTEIKGQPPGYSPNLVTITARIHSGIQLGTWIRNLENLKWIKNVEFSSYRESTEGGAIVELSLQLR